MRAIIIIIIKCNKVGCEMSGASFSTCSTSHLDLSDNNKELYGFHNFEECGSSVIIPYNKSSDKIEIVGVGVENVKKYNDVKSVNGSNKNRIHHKKNNNDNDDDNNNDNNKNIEIIENNDNKCMMNVNNSKYDNEHVLTDLTANGIIIPANITKNDDVMISIPNHGKMSIDGITIGNSLNDVDNNNSISNNNNNVNNNNNTNKDDDDDNDDDGWKSMPSSNDFTATGIETMINNDNNDNDDNITSNISKRKKIEKNRNKSTRKNENENENKNSNQNKNKVKNIHIDESTYDLYTDGTHSKILADRFERVLLVETFKENAGN